MPKPPCDPISDQNRKWRRMMADPDYAAWWRQRMRQLIDVCQFEDRREELRAELRRMEAMDHGIV